MKQSQLFYKTQKNNPRGEVSRNAQLLIRAGYVDKLMAGVYSLLPLGWRVFKKIEQIIREEMNAIGGQELFLPSLQPQEVWQKTDRWNKFDALIYLGFDEEKNMVLGPTHEEIITPIAQKIIGSYKDLPRYVYQFQNKFRNEKRAKSGLLRGREFIMKDLYSFHPNEKDLGEYYEKVKRAYQRIFERCGIGEKTFLTYAGGGAFTKYSHEFQTLTSAGEDLIYICPQCQIAVNEEIIEEQSHQCPECGGRKLKKEKAVEVGNIFKLKARFSQPFGLKFLDKNGQPQDVMMGCYGIGLQRLMGTIVELFNDEKGIIWPLSVAPYQVQLILLNGEKQEVAEAAEKIYQELSEKLGEEVLFDDRKMIGAGEKFAESDLLGIPYRVVISEKTVQKMQLEVKNRRTGKTNWLKKDELVALIQEKNA